MSGVDKNRFRNKTVCFRMSPSERRELETRLRLSGKPKGEFIIESILEGEIIILVGKYESDRLGVEIKHLRDQLFEMVSREDELEVREALLDCKFLIAGLIELMKQEVMQSEVQRESCDEE